MKVFISWSGATSHAVAEALHEWLPKVVPAVEPWMSDEDIAKGVRWSDELWDNLKTSSFGILCLVPGNILEPWVLFEAGALACARASEKLSPFLVGLRPDRLPAPLQQFQCTVFAKKEVQRLIRRLNELSPHNLMTKGDLEQAFQEHWPKLRQRIRRINRSADQGNEPSRGPEHNSGQRTDTGPSLDSLAVRILTHLATMIYDSASAYDIYLKIGKPLRLIKLRLQQLLGLRFIAASTTDLDMAEFKITNAGMKYLDDKKLIS